MSYDLEGNERPVFRKFPPVDPQDLEGITMVLEVAAIFLTDGPDATFTEDEVLEKAHELAGDEFPFADQDARIVIRITSVFQRQAGGRLRLR